MPMKRCNKIVDVKRSGDRYGSGSDLELCVDVINRSRNDGLLHELPSAEGILEAPNQDKRNNDDM